MAEFIETRGKVILYEGNKYYCTIHEGIKIKSSGGASFTRLGEGRGPSVGEAVEAMCTEKTIHLVPEHLLE